MPEFVINDESVLNDRGFRVLTAGINLDQFKKNPLCLFMHSRPSRWDLKSDAVLAIGTWTNLRVEEGKLIGTPVFDEGDEFAKRIKDKVDKGIYRMCSAGLSPVTTSSDERYLLPTQRYETVVESLLLEASIADMGSNPNSLALYKYEKEEYVQLAADATGETIPLLALNSASEAQSEENKPQNLNMKKIALALGMAETATEDEIVAKINDNKTTMVNLTSEVETIRLNAITGAVDAAIAEKRITADKKDQMIALGKTVGVESLRSTLELMKPATKPTDHLGSDSSRSQSADNTITLASLMKQGIKAVEDYKAENPQEYAALYKEHYGTNYVPSVKD